MQDRLELYELDRREPVGHIDYKGRIHLPERHPQVLFAAVPVHLHLSDRLTVAPFDASSDTTGPGPHGIGDQEQAEVEGRELGELEAEEVSAQ